MNKLLILLVFGILLSGCESSTKKSADEKQVLSVSKATYWKEFTAYIIDVTRREKQIFMAADSVEWLTGVDAETMFKKDRAAGIIKDQSFENDLYIRNIARDSILFKITDSTQIITQTFSRNESGEFNFNQKISSEQFLQNSDKLFNTPFRLLIINNDAVKIEEIYLP